MPDLLNIFLFIIGFYGVVCLSILWPLFSNIIFISLTNGMDTLFNHTNMIFILLYFISHMNHHAVERRQQPNVLQMPLLIIGLIWFTFHLP